MRQHILRIFLAGVLLAATMLSMTVAAQEPDSSLRITSAVVVAGQLTISGQNFGASPAVTLLQEENESPLVVVSSSNTEIVVDVSGLAAGAYGVKVTRDGGASDAGQSTTGVVIE
jgi:hypothetical protein